MTSAQRSLRVGDVSSPWLFRALVVTSALAFAAILYVTSYVNFFFDEWELIEYDRPWNLTVLLLPHNEHWYTIPIFIWKLLFVVVGIRSHIPYEAALLAVHLASVFLLFALIRRRSGDLPAFGAALVLLLLGSGGTDIVWAFQIGFVGSVAFGLLAMLVLDGDPPFPSRVLLASAALLGSLMCSGAGLAFLAAVGVELLADGRRRRFLLALVVPVVAFAVWFPLYGAGLKGTPGAPCPTCLPVGFSADIHRGPITVGYVLSLASFVVTGLQASVSAVFGVADLGAILLPVLAVLVALHLYRTRRFASWQLGMVAGVLAWFTLTGLGRAQYGAAAAAESRYMYMGVAFVLPLLAEAARSLRWTLLWRPAIAIVFVLALFANILQMRDRALIGPIPALSLSSTHTEVMRTEDAELQTAEVFRGAPDMTVDGSLDSTIMPQLVTAHYFSAIDELGSPVPHATIDTLRSLPWQDVDREMVNLFGAALSAKPDAARSTQGMVCRDVPATSGSIMSFQVPDGQSIMVKAANAGDAFLFLGYLGPPSAEPLQPVHLQPSTAEWVYLPNTGKPAVWQVRIVTTDLGAVQACSPTPFQVQETVQNVYRGHADKGNLNPGWSAVQDVAASDGSAAKASKGVYPTFRNDVFEGGFVPIQGAYDVWYRVRVAGTAGAVPEMTLGLWDDEGQVWVGATTYTANQAGTDYMWLKVASGVSPTAGHHVQFLASFAANLGADWYVDEAVMVPSGLAPSS
ncbi:MAG: hypothetical protein ACHQ0J_08180 [Candidatus Dormibacterales bacterium]